MHTHNVTVTSGLWNGTLYDVEGCLCGVVLRVERVTITPDACDKVYCEPERGLYHPDCADLEHMYQARRGGV